LKYVNHFLIKEKTIEERAYQKNIVKTCMEHNTLVILPTALGKTIISLLLTVKRLERYPDSKILVLAPTRPLVLQHYESFKRFLNISEEKLIALTGRVPPKKRKGFWVEKQIFFATPQLIRNDLLEKRYSLRDLSLIVFDEGHRARKKYAYTNIAEKYIKQAKNPLILALTASPGKDWETIKKTCEVLFINAVEYRTEKDEDVKPYIPPMDMKWKRVDLPREYEEIKDILKKMQLEEIKNLQSMGLFPYKKPENVTKRELLDLGAKLRASIDLGEGKKSIYAAVMFQAASISLTHALEVLTTQDISVLYKFLKRLEEKSKHSKSARRIIKKTEYKELIRKVENNLPFEHTKLKTLQKIFQEKKWFNPEGRAIVFTQFRDTATKILQSLKNVKNIKPVRFIGQTSKKKDPGLTQEQQAEILKNFRKGKYNVLVATSIAEEGLDIPTVDLVVFYEPIPSEIRFIQRKGRTARKRFGRVVILITNGTVDEIYYWSSKAREKKMKKIIYTLNKAFKEKNDISRELISKQKTLEEF